MPGNSFGTAFRLTTFGESHGEAIGGIIDGCPAGLKLDLERVQQDMQRRKPGQSAIVTQRKEEDHVRLLSGVFDGMTTGMPIGFVIENQNQKSKDYSHIQEVYRPSHADFTWDKKYGHRDYRGGGRSSARETACRVAAGAIAKQLIAPMQIQAYTSAVGSIILETDPKALDLSLAEQNPTRCPDPDTAAAMEAYIKKIRSEGDTVGGIVTCVIDQVPVGLGEPVFDKLHAALGQAMLSINAVKGFEYGSGFQGASSRGSEHNDLFNTDETTMTNNSGGIQGGVSNGMPIVFRVAFKPVATLMQKQMTIDKEGKQVEMQGKGRHDPCVVPRAVPIVEAMAALVMADFSLRNRSSKL